MNAVRCPQKGCHLTFLDGRQMREHLAEDHYVHLPQRPGTSISAQSPARAPLDDTANSKSTYNWKTITVNGPYNWQSIPVNGQEVNTAEPWRSNQSQNGRDNQPKRWEPVPSTQNSTNERQTIPTWGSIRASIQATKTVETAASGISLPDARWTIIPNENHSTAITQLIELCHPHKLLEKQGYFRISKEGPLIYRAAPPASPYLPKRRAIALDCEMVGARDHEREHNVLARLSVIDYLTSEVIIDAFVEPDRRVTDWRTRYSGVTRGDMNAAIRAGEALAGYQGAQNELWKWIDSETVIVGQALKNDFDVLKITHPRVVDCGIVCAQIVNTSRSQFSLKSVCTELLEIRIQQGRRGHDSIEDSLAAREVVLFCLNKPEKVERWAKVKREEQAAADAKRAAQLEKEREERRIAKDKSISWSKPVWPEPLTTEERKVIKVRVPVSSPLSQQSTRPIQSHRKQRLEVSDTQTHWETTISQSKKMLVPADPDSTEPILKFPPKRKFSEQESPEMTRAKYPFNIQRIPHRGSERPEDTSATLLDLPFEYPDDSFLAEPLLPTSP